MSHAGRIEFKYSLDFRSSANKPLFSKIDCINCLGQ